MIKKIDDILKDFFLSKYQNEVQETSTQAKELLYLYITIFGFVALITLFLDNFAIELYMHISMSLIIFILFLIKMGKLNWVIPLSIFTMMILFSLVVFSKTNFSLFDVYQLLSIYMFILFISIFFMRTILYSYMVAVIGLAVITYHYFFIKKVLLKTTYPNMEDYVTSMGIIIISTIIVSYVIKRYNKVIQKLNEQLKINNQNIRDLEESNFQLQKSENRFKLISSNLPSVLLYQVEINTKGERKFTYLSDNITQITELTKEEVLADSSKLYDLIDPANKEILVDAEAEAIRNNHQFSFETRTISPSGKVKWFKLVSTPYISDNDKMVFDGVQIDITELKEAQQKYYESQKYFETALINTPSGIIISDAGLNKITFANSPAFFGEARSNKLLSFTEIMEKSKRIQLFHPDGSRYPFAETPAGPRGEKR